MRLYTNQTPDKTIRAAIEKKSYSVKSIKIASAFFSYDEIVVALDSRGVKVDLIVRLSEATSPNALRRIYKLPNVQVRYYTNSHFHPKFYIFGESSAIIGSANFTSAGCNSNNEICIEIPAGGEEFDDLAYVFQGYWDEAKVLTPEALKEYELLHAQFRPKVRGESFEGNLLSVMGDYSPPSNIIVRTKKQSKKTIFVDDYERTYQIFEKAFRVVEKIYQANGKRRVSSAALPLRIEIDQLFNFIRTKLTSGESYNEAPIRTGEVLERYIEQVLEQWFAESWPYIDTVTKNYAIIQQQFASEEKIDSLSLEEVFNALDVCHAFHEQLRYEEGGYVEFKKAFLRKSNEAEIKRTIKYLLHDQGRYVERMANCIFGSYKVPYLSRYSIQELLGWVNTENIPICNTRTLKSLRYLGAINSIIPSISRTQGLRLAD